MTTKYPPGPPMTLGNMRELSAQRLVAFCLNDSCRHQALIDVSSYPAETEVPWFKGRVKCGKCGGRGNKNDVRPNWERAAAGAADEVTVRLTSAFGRAAEVHRRTTSAAVDANDPGCVKTQKIVERRERFFQDGVKSNSLANVCAPKRESAKCLFYRIRPLGRFYTTKTRRRHEPHRRHAFDPGLSPYQGTRFSR